MKSTTGVFVTTDQFVAAKSEHCCNTNSVEGITHESSTPFVGVILNLGREMVCEVQTPPFKKTLATSLFPSADDATENQSKVLEALFDTQVLPESVEV